MRRFPAALLIPLFCVGSHLLSASVAQAKDAFLKAGIIFHPSEADLASRWLVTFGKDFPLNLRETIFWGIELQGSIYSIEERGGTTQIIPANGFLNLKYKADKFDYRPYAGIGLGMVTYFALADGNNQWIRHGGFHFQVGMELKTFVIELQAQRAFVEDEVFQYAFLVGLTF